MYEGIISALPLFYLKRAAQIKLLITITDLNQGTSLNDLCNRGHTEKRGL